MLAALGCALPPTTDGRDAKSLDNWIRALVAPADACAWVDGSRGPWDGGGHTAP
jgi:hypothetical protein